MIDRSSTSPRMTGRVPDVRLHDIRNVLIEQHAPFEYRIDSPDRSMCVRAVRGDFELEVVGRGRRLKIPEGSAVGFESGQEQVWRVPRSRSPRDRAIETAALFVSSIPKSVGVLQRLKDGYIVVPADAEPYASAIRLSVEIHMLEMTHPAANGDDSVIRRCAEIGVIQFVRYARSRHHTQADAPKGLAHDENLLRAWSAFFDDPQGRWTVEKLADAAGLSRSSFAARFRKVFGKPPLQTLSELRLEQAEAMLRHSRAPIIEIAFTVGYGSEAAFVRAFHRLYGIPPGQFRKRHMDGYMAPPTMSGGD